MSFELRALYGEDDAKKVLGEAKRLGFSTSRQSGQKVTVAGFTGNGPDELTAFRELSAFYAPLHVEVSRIARNASWLDGGK